MGIQIETERLILKNYDAEDLVNIYRLKSDPLVWRFSDKEVIRDIEEVKKHLKGVLRNYSQNIYDFQGLFLKNTNEYIGEGGIISLNKKHKRAVIGYNLLPGYWNRGYATEITKALVKYLFSEGKIERIEALVCDGNEASKKVLEKSGFLQEGLLRNYAYVNNSYLNIHYYGMVRQDYFMNHD